MLDHVVQIGRGDQGSVVAGVGEQLGDCDRVLDELLSGLLAVLAEVNAPGEAQRGPGQIRVLGSGGVDTSAIKRNANGGMWVSQSGGSGFTQIAGKPIDSSFTSARDLQGRDPRDRLT